MGVIKVVKVLLFIAKKYPEDVIVGCLLSSVAYLYSGPVLTFVTALLTVLYLLYHLGDVLLYTNNTPKDSRTNVQSPSDFDLPFESLCLTTEDNVRINALLIKRPEPECSHCPTVIYFHGNSGNVGHRLQHVSDLYRKNRCNLLCVEYRGFGLSEGRPSEQGLKLDARAALDYVLQQQDLNSDKIVVFGRSLGGAVAIDLVANSPKRSRVSALVAENTFTTLPDIARKLFPVLGSLPDWAFKNQWRSIDSAKNITVPALFLSGLSDETVPPRMMTALYDQCPSSVKRLARFESGNHKFTHNCDNYYETVSQFFAEVFAEDKNSSEKLNDHSFN